MDELTRSDLHGVEAEWAPKRETLDVCATRLVRLLEQLPTVDPLLADWYRRPPEQPLEPEAVTLARMLDAGRTFNDEGDLMPELGFTLRARNHDRDDDVFNLHANLGVWSSWGANGFGVSWPSKLRAHELDRVTDLGWLRRLIAALVRASDADWVETSTRRLRTDASVPNALRQPTGWLVWLPVAAEVVPPLPGPTSLEPFEGGTLISSVSGERVPHETTEQDVELIRDRNRRLHDAGLTSAAD